MDKLLTFKTSHSKSTKKNNEILNNYTMKTLIINLFNR